MVHRERRPNSFPPGTFMSHLQVKGRAASLSPALTWSWIELFP